MVEISQSTSGVPRYAGVVGGTDNGRQKTRNHGYDVIVGRAVYWLLRSPSQTCHAKLKLKSTGAGHFTAFFPVGGMPTASNGLKDFSPKVRTLWHCNELRSVALYLWLIVVISVNQSTVTLAIWASLPGAGYVWIMSIRLTAWLQNWLERSERLMYEQNARCSTSLVICIIVCLSWAVNHYRDNAITYKAQRDKTQKNWSWRTRQLLTCRCVSVMLLRSMQNTRRS